jgi:tetratricopeptide (TPR) repeat protein
MQRVKVQTTISTPLSRSLRDFYPLRGFKFSAQSYRLLNLVIFGLSIFTLCSCAGTPKSKVIKTKEGKIEVPVGVDTSVAMVSQRMARQLFAEYPQQVRAKRVADSAVVRFERSERLWKILEGQTDSTGAVDSVAAIEKFNEAGRSLKQAVELDKQATASADAADLRRQSLVALDKARAIFEISLQYNPFDNNTKLWLAKTYQLLAKRYLNDQNYIKAIGILEHLTRLQRDQHALHARLGDCYMALKKYPTALQNFKKAEEVLKATTAFNVPAGRELNVDNITAATDSSAMFLYLYYQAESYIKLLDADSALYALHRASDFSPTPESRAAAENNIKWINWDDGNIPASEKRDSLFARLDAGKFADAAKGFRKLLPDLRTKRTRREIGWRLATLEFNYLKNEEEALHLMQTVVQARGRDSLEVVADTLYQKYIDSYGAMCFNQGQKMMVAKKFTTALTYFQHSSLLPWNFRAKSYLELGKLSVNDPPRAENFVKQALKLSAQLDHRDEVAALELATQSLKRQGKFDEARQYFERYRRAAQGQRASN